MDAFGIAATLGGSLGTTSGWFNTRVLFAIWRPMTYVKIFVDDS